MWNMKDYLKLRKEELKKRGAKGFTLMEMLIVVAIIAVLIAIAIPVFTAQLEKARDATTLANLRSAYAEASAKYLTDNTNPVDITNVAIESTDADYGAADKLPFKLPNSLPNAGKYTAKFTFSSDGAAELTSLTKENS
jgi:prepilin-type N-terminal cleavage/methylation domain-containing protein